MWRPTNIKKLKKCQKSVSKRTFFFAPAFLIAPFSPKKMITNYICFSFDRSLYCKFKLKKRKNN